MPVLTIKDKKTAKDKFLKFLKKSKSCLCFYYMTGCYHCNEFSPKWANVMSQYQNHPEHSKKFNIINIEYEATKELPEQFKIYAFPTVVLYVSGKKIEEYKGDRSENSLHEFVHSKILNKK